MLDPTEPGEVAFPHASAELLSGVAQVRVFVDYWNFQLSLNRHVGAEHGDSNYRFKVDWKALGPWLARKACEAVGVVTYSFHGVIIYTSFDPRTQAGSKFRRWVKTFLDLQPGVSVVCLERKPKAPPTCPASNCQREIKSCPHCNRPMLATEEKGVDTFIATDMIRLAWEDAYDLAVLATSDRDLIPAVQFLTDQKGKRIIQVGFPPLGADLARACWASFDAYKDKHEIERDETVLGTPTNA